MWSLITSNNANNDDLCMTAAVGRHIASEREFNIELPCRHSRGPLVPVFDSTHREPYVSGFGKNSARKTEIKERLRRTFEMVGPP